ncbi:hypothetical protein TNCV_780271 [Trichonephila clavipes]|nr:hypothetical protein TNCV_780271 [Trichonephila clavipes]
MMPGPNLPATPSSFRGSVGWNRLNTTILHEVSINETSREDSFGRLGVIAKDLRGAFSLNLSRLKFSRSETFLSLDRSKYRVLGVRC